MSLRNEILTQLVTLHPEACKLLSQLLQVIDLDLKSFATEKVQSFDLSSLADENLCLFSEEDPQQELLEHSHEITQTLFKGLQEHGVEFKSVNSSAEILFFKTKMPDSYLVKWVIDIDNESCFEVMDKNGIKTVVDFYYDTEAEQL
jgi:hypothetical protein